MLWLTLLIALIIAVAVAWILFRADRQRAVPYPWLTAALRGLVILLTLVLLLAPPVQKKNTHIQKPVIVLLQDNSVSVALALGKDTTSYAQSIRSLAERLSGKFRLVTRNLEGQVTTDSLFRYTSPVTDIAKAISDATELYGQQNLGAILLASDGRYNQGANPLYSNLPTNGSLYTLAIGDTAIPKDLRISKTYANKTASLNSQFELRADISASRCTGYQNALSLTDAAGHVIATSPVHIGSDQYDGTVSFSVTASKPGLQHYLLTLPDAGSEANTSNNKTSIFIEVVEEKKNILVVAAAPHPDIRAITDALSGLEQFTVTVKTIEELPADLTPYACIVLHQLPATGTALPERLKNLKKNTWYITGPQSAYATLNQWQQAVSFQAGYSFRDAAASFNTSFNSFGLPAEIRSVTDILPPLSVPAGNITAQAGTAVLFRQNTGQPLWVLGQGSNPVAVLCGEGLWRWRLYEYKHTGRHLVIDECIRQTITYLTAANTNKPFRTELPKYIWSYPEHVSVNAYLYNSNNEAVNQPEALLSITDSSGREQQFSFERNGNAYRLDAGTLAAGTYQYKAKTSYNGKAYTDAGTFVMSATSPEYLETGCNYPLLYALAQRNNGTAFLASQTDALYDSIIHNTDIRPLITETTEQAPLIDRKWLFFLIVVVAAAEWLLRKYWMAM